MVLADSALRTDRHPRPRRPTQYAVQVQQPVAKVRVKRGTAQQHLLDAAQQLFAERGYRGTTTKDIAQNAGVSENLIFRYFKSKSELMVVASPRY
jgi:AraC-like DNA-binding protein